MNRKLPVTLLLAALLTAPSSAYALRATEFAESGLEEQLRDVLISGDPNDLVSGAQIKGARINPGTLYGTLYLRSSNPDALVHTAGTLASRALGLNPSAVHPEPVEGERPSRRAELEQWQDYLETMKLISINVSLVMEREDLPQRAASGSTEPSIVPMSDALLLVLEDGLDLINGLPSLTPHDDNYAGAVHEIKEKFLKIWIDYIYILTGEKWDAATMQSRLSSLHGNLEWNFEHASRSLAVVEVLEKFSNDPSPQPLWDFQLIPVGERFKYATKEPSEVMAVSDLLDKMVKTMDDALEGIVRRVAEVVHYPYEIRARLEEPGRLEVPTYRRALLLGGVGNIGRGHIALMLSRDNYDIFFIDFNQSLIAAANERDSYVVTPVGRGQPVTVRNFWGIDARDQARVAAQGPRADWIFTTVGTDNIIKLRDMVYQFIRNRIAAGHIATLNIVFAENLPIDQPQIAALRQAVLKMSDDQTAQYIRDHVNFIGAPPVEDFREYDHNHVGWAGAVVGITVPPTLAKADTGNPLDISVEGGGPYELVVDGKEMKNMSVVPSGIKLVDNIYAAREKKLLIHNMGHAAFAYLAWILGMEPSGNPALAIQGDPRIGRVVRRAMEESAAGLIHRYPTEFNRAEMDDYIGELLERFANVELNDTIERIARDPLRKLAVNDRLVGAAISAREVGVEPEAILLAVAAAIRYAEKQNVPIADLETVKRQISELGFSLPQTDDEFQAAFGRLAAGLEEPTEPTTYTEIEAMYQAELEKTEVAKAIRNWVNNRPNPDRIPSPSIFDFSKESKIDADVIYLWLKRKRYFLSTIGDSLWWEKEGDSPVGGWEEKGVQVMMVEELARMRDDPGARALAAHLATQQRAGVALLPRAKVDTWDLTDNTNPQVEIYAHPSVASWVPYWLPSNWGLHKSTQLLADEPDPAKTQLEKAAKAVTAGRTVLIALDHTKAEGLELPEAVVMWVNPDNMNGIQPRVVAAFLSQARKFTHLILDLTSGSIRTVTIGDREYYALDIAA